MSTKLNILKKTLLPLTMLASMGLAQPALAIDADGGKLKYGLQWFESTGDGRGKAYDALTNNWLASAEVPLTAYDPKQPTIIYFHGWQAGANGKREDFRWTNGSGVSFEGNNTLANLKTAGYNVGVYYWDQFADEGEVAIPAAGSIGVNVSYAEAKIWTPYGPQGFRYKYKDPLTGKYKHSTLTPSPEQLNFPSLDGGDRWGAGTVESNVKSAVQFIFGTRPGTESGRLIVRELTPLHTGKNCLEFVREVVCKYSVSKGLGASSCSPIAPKWEELFVKKVCPGPAIADMAALDLMRAMPNQTGRVQYAGHSLGHQLATRTAHYFWGAWWNMKNPTFKKWLPHSVDMLDPYATSGEKLYLGKGYTFAKGNLAPLTDFLETGSTADRVFHYMTDMRNWSIDKTDWTTGIKSGVLGDYQFNGVYYLSSLLSRTPGSTMNVRLMNMLPSQRLFFKYVENPLDPVGEATKKHNGAKHWYFASFQQKLFTAGTTILPGVSGYDFVHGLGSHTHTSLEFMRKAEAGRAHFAQYEGTNTFTLADDVFLVCRKDFAFTTGSFLGIQDYSCPEEKEL